MKIKQLFTLMLIGMIAPAVAMAQDWKTDIPKEITTPDHVPSELGDLDFKDGYPTQETANKVRDELDWLSLVNIAVFVNY